MGYDEKEVTQSAGTPNAGFMLQNVNPYNKFIQHYHHYPRNIARMIGGNQQDPGMGYCIRLSLQQQLMITQKKIDLGSQLTIYF